MKVWANSNFRIPAGGRHRGPFSGVLPVVLLPNNSVTLDRDYYLDAYGSPLSHKCYARLVRLTHGETADRPKACLTIDDLMAKSL
jgi:hypothetical protein